MRTAQRNLQELRETYYGVLQILNQFIANDKFTQNHSYRVSVYATQIAAEMGLRHEQIEDVPRRSAAARCGKTRDEPRRPLQSCAPNRHRNERNEEPRG